tara:strand:- start:881 stop:1075 length:195 start_codon:yes stop_codon:yes gene_type:complete
MNEIEHIKPCYIGNISNTYGCLLIKKEEGVYSWGIDDSLAATYWEEIPQSLFDELNNFNKTKLT